MGFSAQRLSERQLNAFEIPGWRILGGEDFDAHASSVGGYGQMRWTMGRVTFTPGTRIDYSGLADQWVGSPWLQADWQVPGDLTVVFGAGLHHQFPEFAQVVGRRGQAGLDPERAVHVDLGIEGQLGATARWQVSGYNREERDVVDLPDSYYRLVDDVVQPPSADDTLREQAGRVVARSRVMVQTEVARRAVGMGRLFVRPHTLHGSGHGRELRRRFRPAPHAVALWTLSDLRSHERQRALSLRVEPASHRVLATAGRPDSFSSAPPGTRSAFPSIRGSTCGWTAPTAGATVV